MSAASAKSEADLTVSQSEGHNRHRTQSTATGTRPAATKLLQNPLAGMSCRDVLADADNFVLEKGLENHREAFRKGSVMAKVQNVPSGYEDLVELNETDKEILRHEDMHRWSSQPKMLYFLCALCAGCAIVQGMDQTVINGAQVRTNPLPLHDG